MSLLTRMVLLLALVVLSVAMAAGLFVLGDDTSSGIDRFVAARNQKEAYAYQTVRITGGLVPKSVGVEKLEAGDQLVAAERAGSVVSAEKSLLARESWRALVGLKKLEQEAGKYAKGWADGDKTIPSLDALRKQISEANGRRRQETAAIARAEDDITNLGLTLASYSKSIGHFSQAVFNADYEVHRKLADADALRAEKQQIEVDTARLMLNKAGLEDENARLTGEFERAAKVLSMYQSRDPGLRSAAASAGKPWMRGEVVRTGTDPMSGLVWVNLGSVDGLREGQRLAIQRGGSFVAYMRVESVGAGESLGRLEEGFRGNVRVMQSDVVRSPSNFAIGG